MTIGHFPADSDDERLRKSLLTIVGTALIFCGAVWAVMYVLLGVPRAAWFPGGFSVLSFCSLVYFVVTKRYGFYRFSQLFLILILPVALQWALGGFVASSVVIIWAILSPMGALMFSGRYQSTIWFGAFVALLGISLAFDSRLAENAASIPAPFPIVLFFMNIGGTLGILFVAMQFFERARDAALTQTRRLLVEVGQKAGELEQQNAALSAGLKKLEDLNHSKDQVFKRVSGLYDTTLPRLRDMLTALQRQAGETSQLPLQGTLYEVQDAMNGLKPLTLRYSSEQAMRSKRLLLAESDVKRQIVAKMALAGTGVIMDIATDAVDGRQKIDTAPYDIICIDSKMIELAQSAIEKNPKIKTVFMTADDIKGHLAELKRRPFLSNVVCSDDQDRTFTVKNITTTVSKLVNQDIFGLEKYLGWGVEVQEVSVHSSVGRGGFISEMESYFRKAGLTGAITRRAVTVAEELLSNAIYDAPVDKNRKPLYNHLPRTEAVELPPHQGAVFRYASDGILVGVSVSDPFGELTRETILEYLISCYEGRAGSLNTNKGGAGRGLFQIMESSSLVVFNVREHFRTEVCAFFNVDIQVSKRMNERSFHFFFE